MKMPVISFNESAILIYAKSEAREHERICGRKHGTGEPDWESHGFTIRNIVSHVPVSHSVSLHDERSNIEMTTWAHEECKVTRGSAAVQALPLGVKVCISIQH